MNNPPLPIATQFAELACRQATRDHPAEVLHAAKRCIIDWFAATLPGSTAAPARALELSLADELGHGTAWTLSGKRAAQRTAALINGTASHTAELDDIYAPAIYHPGSPTIAAALAAAQQTNATGRSLLNGIIAGYEVSTRIGEALGRSHYRYWHTTGTVGTFGATAAAGLLHECNIVRMANALGTAATLAAGLQQAFRGDSEIKPIHAGHAADAALIAVALARGNISCAPDMFEGSSGLAAAMGERIDWLSVLADTDSYNICRITIKNHPCCGHIFAALDGIMALQEEHGFSASDILLIVVGGYSATVEVTGNTYVEPSSAAKFSLPFVLANSLIYGKIALDSFEPVRRTDVRIHELMSRIEVKLDPEVDSLFPAQRAARIAVTLGDGRKLQHFQPHRIGDPELPLSDSRLSDKFLEFADSALPRGRAKKLLEALWELERVPNLSFTHELHN